MGFKDQIAYRIYAAIRMLIFMIVPLITIAIWSAIYGASGSAHLGGYSFREMEIYILFNAALIMFITTDLTERFSMGVFDGSVARFLIKPVGIVGQNILYMSAELAVSSIPMVVAIAALVFFHIPISLMSAFAIIISAALGFLVLQLIWFIINVSSVYFTNVFGFYSLFWTLNGIVGGTLIPLTLLPHALYSAFSLSPLQFAFYLPSALVVGTISPQYAFSLIPLGAAWVIALFALGYIEWKHAIKRINSVGV